MFRSTDGIAMIEASDTELPTPILVGLISGLDSLTTTISPVAASSWSWISRLVSSPRRIVTSETVWVLKPERLATTSYGPPTLVLDILKTPATSVTVAYRVPVVVRVAVIVTPGIGSPLGSLTVPDKEPVVAPCEYARPATRVAHNIR